MEQSNTHEITCLQTSHTECVTFSAHTIKGMYCIMLFQWFKFCITYPLLQGQNRFWYEYVHVVATWIHLGLLDVPSTL